MVVNNKKKTRASLENKIKEMLDNGNTLYLTKTQFGTRKNQYCVTFRPKETENEDWIVIQNEQTYFGRMLSRLISKVYKKHI